jgi:hypothetical protein
MPFQEHLEATLTWTSSSASYQSKLYYTVSEGMPDLSVLVQVADFINAKMQSALRAVIPDYITLQPVTVRVRGGEVDIEDQSSEPAAVGTWTGGGTEPEDDVLPEGDQIVIQRRTGLAGRSKRGRVFLPFVPEQLVDNSTLNAVGLPRYKTIATKMSQTIDMGGLGDAQPVTPDYKNQTMRNVTHCRVVSEVCTRRDRRAPQRPVYFRAPN